MRTGLCGNAGNRAIFLCNFHDFRLFQHQILLLLQYMLHIGTVGGTVSLCPEGMDSRALAAVEQTVLDAGRIRRTAHFTAQCVNFTHQMSLCRAANGRIAWHIANSIQINGEDNGL